jgi:hypothetical protein
MARRPRFCWSPFPLRGTVIVGLRSMALRDLGRARLRPSSRQASARSKALPPGACAVEAIFWEGEAPSEPAAKAARPEACRLRIVQEPLAHTFSNARQRTWRSSARGESATHSSWFSARSGSASPKAYARALESGVNVSDTDTCVGWRPEGVGSRANQRVDRGATHERDGQRTPAASS